MDLIRVLPAFLLFVLAIAAVPGPAMALILRRAAVHGGRATVPLVLGLETALFCWAIAAALGLAALVAASEVAYTVLRVAGSVVLVGLGLLALRAAWLARRAARGEERAEDGALGGEVPPAADDLGGREVALKGRGLGARRAFAEGLVTNLANPKAAIFMVALFPQFIPPGYPVLPSTLVLASVQVTLETVLYCGLAFGVGRARHLIDRGAARAALDLVSGTVLVGLGVKIATTARSV